MNETAARIDWAGAGVRLPRRLCRPCGGAPGGAASARRRVAGAAGRRARRMGLGQRCGRAGGVALWMRSARIPSDMRTSVRPTMERALACGATGGGALDRGDRARGWAGSFDGGVLGRPLRAGVGPSRAPRRPWWDPARDAGRARGGGPERPRNRPRGWTGARPPCAIGCAGTAWRRAAPANCDPRVRAANAGCRDLIALLPGPRRDGVCARHRRLLPLPAVPRRRRSTSRRARIRDWRSSPRPAAAASMCGYDRHPGRAAVPSHRPGEQGLHVVQRRHAIARAHARGGRQVRAVVRELPRRGGDRVHPASRTIRPGTPSGVAQEADPG